MHSDVHLLDSVLLVGTLVSLAAILAVRASAALACRAS